MSKFRRIRLWSGVTVISVALVLLAASFLTNQPYPETASAARDLGARIEKRVNVLDT